MRKHGRIEPAAQSDHVSIGFVVGGLERIETLQENLGPEGHASLNSPNPASRLWRFSSS